MNGMGETPKVIMRAPKVTVIPKDNYEKQYWPSIRTALNQIINHPNEIMFSHEELYRNIYNLCCQRHTVVLYNDLINFVMEYLRTIYMSLCATPDEVFVAYISQIFQNFKRVTDSITGVFKYLEKIYIKEKLNTSINAILLSSFNTTVISTPEIQQRLARTLRTIPTNSDPAIIMHLTKGLYELNKEYAALHPQLFAMYIPCLQPSRGLDLDSKEAQEIIMDLRNRGFVNTVERTQKRKYYIMETT